MRGGRRILGVVAAVVLLAAGCGGEKPDGGGGPGGASPTPTPAAAKAPTRQEVVALLRSLLTALEAKDFERAAGYLVAFPGMKPGDAAKAVATFVEKREISAHGIDVLEEKGKFGALLEVFPERAEYLAKKAGVDPAQCVALALDPAEVAVYWGGDRLRLIRLDDVGKL